jgi:hypothetical protein
LNTSGLKPKKDELVVLSYSNNGVSGLAQVYNHMWAMCEHYADDAVFVFCHHDIHFQTSQWGKCLLRIFNENDVDILGVAGTPALLPHCVWWEGQGGSKDHLFGKVWHEIKGKGRKYLTDFTGYKLKQKLYPVVLVDGLFLAFNPKTCLKFNENFTGFHFYDIPWCIDNHLAGKKLFVTESIQIVHESGGETNAEWEQNRQKMAELYLPYFENGVIKVT